MRSIWFILAAILAFAVQDGRSEPPSVAVRFVAAARAQVGKTVAYDPTYTVLAYPGGDVPIEKGVCTDVAIRAFRAVGIDLQKEVHEDMERAWAAYPHLWNLRRPDPNIDHRRVPNLIAFLKRHAHALPVNQEAGGYQPGDLVTCLVAGNLPHIMVVSDARAAEEQVRHLVIHNIGHGAQEEDRLFEFEITGHFRFWQD